jgi:exopolysaccharide biosynthesis polyprenyl glycosylphosphotransferase
MRATTELAHEWQSPLVAGTHTKWQISSSTCSAALMFADLAIITCAAIIASRLATDSDTTVILLCGVIAALISLCSQGAYTMASGGQPVRAVACGWVNASGWLALGWYGYSILISGLMSRPAGLPDQEWLAAFFLLGGAAVLVRGVLWVRLRSRTIARITRSKVVAIGLNRDAANALQRHDELCEIVSLSSDLRGSWPDDVVELVRGGGVDTVFIALSEENAVAASSLIAQLADYPVAVRISPQTADIYVHAVSLQAGLPVLHVSDPPLGLVAACIKRAEDICLAAVLIVLTFPVMLLVGLAIRLESGRPILFRQSRQGLGGSNIAILKFRTMYSECEDRIASRQTCKGDPRVTPVGTFLRRHSLDELPQLFNVLRGSMSLIGPRPHAPGTTVGGEALNLAVCGYMARHRMKPGLTGWAQVSGYRGNLDTIGKALGRIECDLYYIQNWSLLLDLKILLRTVALIAHDEQAF